MWKETPVLTLSSEPASALIKTGTRHKPILQELTMRERQILQLMADGLNSRQMAEMLCISIDTIESHRKSLHRKLQVSSAAEAVAWGFRKRVIK